MQSAQAHIGRRAFIEQIARGAVLGGGTLLAGCPARRDTVHIIGSGITGLCAGAMLARRGFEVHVLESNAEILGGHAAVFHREGFQFCVGPQYVWNFRDEGIGLQVLRELGLEGRIPFDSMAPDGFEVFRIGNDRELAIPMGLDRFRDTVMEAFPGDYAGLTRFFSYLGDLHEGARVIDRFGLYTGGECAMALGLLLDEALSPRAKLRFYQCREWTLRDLFNFCGLSIPVRRILYGHGGIFVENESEVSCVAYAAATGYYHAGADFPRFGFQSLVRGLSDCIEAAGGTVETDRRVVSLRRSESRITSVQTHDGEIVETGFVISTLSPRLTFALIEPRAVSQALYAPSNSAITAFIGVRDYPGLPGDLAERNLWWQDGRAEVEFSAPDMAQPPRLLAVGSPTSKGRHNRNPHPGDHSIVVFAPGNFAQAAAACARSPAAHDDLRAEIAASLVAQVEAQLLPSLRPHMRYIEVHTPRDLFLRTGGESGNIYGRRLTPGSLLTRPYTLAGVSNLHIACASAGMPGIATAFQTAARLVDTV